MRLETKLIPITWLNGCEHGYACGYVGVTKEHPFWELDYSEIENKYDISIHGGLTFSSHTIANEATPDIWWIGFDTAHSGDNQFSCDKTYCEQQLEALKQQTENPKLL